MIKRSDLLNQIEQLLRGNEAEMCAALHATHFVVRRSEKTELMITVKEAREHTHFILRIVEPR